MQILICDDCEEDRKLLREYIEAYCGDKHFSQEITEADSGEALLQLDNLPDFDLVFMDVFMGEMNGMETSRLMQDRGFHGDFIYTTSSTEHVFASFAFPVLDYLVKPFTFHQLEQAMDKYCRERKSALITIPVSIDGTIHQIPVSQIVTVETAPGHRTLLHLKSKSIICRTPIGDIEHLLTPYSNFIRCHRSFLINLDEVAGIENDTVYMRNNTSAMVVQRNASDIKKKINNYLWQHMMEDM